MDREHIRAYDCAVSNIQLPPVGAGGLWIYRQGADQPGLSNPSSLVITHDGKLSYHPSDQAIHESKALSRTFRECVLWEARRGSDVTADGLVRLLLLSTWIEFGNS